MRSRIVAALLFGTVACLPAASALAQGEPPPNRVPGEQAAPADLPAALGACGSTGATMVDRSTIGVAPVTQGTTPGEDNKEGQGEVNLTSVRGTIVHAEGNLMLVKLPDNVATGNTSPAGRPADTLAVVRLPADCPTGMLSEGDGVLALGTPEPDGILNAESIQPAE
jgi:hypothetical protein